MRPHARTARKPPRTSVATYVAVLVTVLWHGALVGWLSTFRSPMREVRSAAMDAEAIDIVFVPRREAAAPPVDRASPAPVRREPTDARAMQPPQAPTEPQVAPGSMPHASAERLDIVTGDDRWSPAPTAAEPNIVIAPRNPLARVDRDALDATPRLRVPMRSPPSLETWLKALAPAGYEANPCPEIARAITGLASDAAPESRALLDHAVDFEARYCR